MSVFVCVGLWLIILSVPCICGFILALYREAIDTLFVLWEPQEKTSV